MIEEKNFNIIEDELNAKDRDLKNKLNEKLLFEGVTETTFNLESAMQIIGDFNLYQIYSVIFLSLVWVSVPSIPIMIPYYRMIPESKCLNNNSTVHICSLKEYCNNDVLKIQSDYLKNWETDFKISCDNSIYYGVLASTYFLGTFIGFLFVSNLSNKYGRKRILLIFLCIYLFLSLCIVCYSTLFLLFIYLFVIGVIYSGTTMCAFILVFESTSKNYKVILTTFISMSFGVGALINISLFYYLRDWRKLVAISFLICLILIFICRTIQESPELLYNHKNYSELKLVLRYIAKTNNREKEFEEYLLQNRLDCYTSDKYSNTPADIIDLVKEPIGRFKLVLMSLNWFIMTLTFYGMNFNLNNFGIDNFITGIIIYLSEAIAQFLSMFLVIIIGDKKSIIVYYYITAISLIILNILPYSGIYVIAIKTVLIFLAKFGISSITNVNYMLTGRIFPISTRMGALSICKIISRIGAISSTLILEATSYSMILFGCLCLLISNLIILYEDSLEE